MSERLRKGAELQTRVFGAATVALRFHRRIYRSEPSVRDLSRQLLRSATSIGANLEEADAAQSRPDFISKCTISLKEAREALYWSRLMQTQLEDQDLFDLSRELNEIVAILTTIVRKSRGVDTVRDSIEEYAEW